MENPTAWHHLTVEQAATLLGVRPDRGLTSKEARRRRVAHRPPRHGLFRLGGWRYLARQQLLDPWTGLLVVVAGWSTWQGALVDGLAVLAILVAHAGLGFVQAVRTHHTFAAHRAQTAPAARVLRDGVLHTVDARSLVPGDLVHLAPGDRVPADLRLVEAHDLAIDGSALTQASAPVRKSPTPVPFDAPRADRTSLAHRGTIVVRGRGTGLVTTTGDDAAPSSPGSPQAPPTRVHRRLVTVGRRLGGMAIAAGLGVGLVGIGSGWPPEAMGWAALCLAVALVPRHLPAMLGPARAASLEAMARRGVLVRRPSAIEDLGDVTVVCTDTRSTLTAGRETVVRLLLPEGPVDVAPSSQAPTGDLTRAGQPLDPTTLPFDVEALVDSVLRNVDARGDREDDHHDDPTDAALLALGRRVGKTPPEAPRWAEHPAQPDRLRRTCVTDEFGALQAHCLGTPEAVLPRCSTRWTANGLQPLVPADRAAVDADRSQAAQAGLRMLAVAHRRLPEAVDPQDADAVEQDLTLLGLVLIEDPPRADAADAIARTHAAGMRVLVVTQDAPETAAAIARQVGIDPGPFLTGDAIDAMDDDALAQVLRGEALVAQASPTHAVRLVDVLQQRGEVVASAGSGIHDIPALRAADLGVTRTGRGTEAVRDAADVVIPDDLLGGIVLGALEGRRHRAAVSHQVRGRLTRTIGIVLTVIGGVALGLHAVVLPLQILWMHGLGDGMAAILPSLPPRDVAPTPGQPDRRPAPWGWVRAWTPIALAGTWIGGSTLGLFLTRLGEASLASTAHAQTIAFTGLVALAMVHQLVSGRFGRSRAAPGEATGRRLLLAAGVGAAAQLAAVYAPPLQALLHTVPLSPTDWRDLGLLCLPLLLSAGLPAIRRAPPRPQPPGASRHAT